MADGKVVIDTALNNNGFTRGVKNLKGELGGLASVVKQLGGVIGVAFGVKALVDFGKASVKLGSDVAEVQNVVDVAFGDMSYKIEEFAKTSIQSFGMSRLAAKETASNFMAMGKSMGLSTEAASDMAVAATGLSGDVASFFNISQDLAKIRLRGIWTGETEALKELGVVMTETNLQEYALANGVEESYDAMNQAERVSLRYSYVMDALSLANGDFIRTQDNWANQTRILSMQWEEFMSIVGQALVTVLTPLVKTLNSIVSAMIDTANAVNSVITAMFGGTSSQMQQTEQDASNVGDEIKDSVGNQDDLTDAVKDTNKAQKKSLAAFDEINKITTEIASTSTEEPLSPETPSPGNGQPEEGQSIDGFASKMMEFIEGLRAGFLELKGWFTDFFTPFKESWDTSGAAVLESAKDTAGKVLDAFRAIGAAFVETWSDDTGVTILNTIHSITTKIFEIAGALTERFRTAWEANSNGEVIWQGILNIIQSVLNFVDRIAAATLEWARRLNLEPIVAAFRGLLDAIGPLVDLILDGLAWGYENVLLPLAKWVIEKAAPAAIDLLSAAIDALTPVVEALKPFGLWLWNDFLKPLGQWTGEIIIYALNTLTEALRKFSDWARENQETIRGIAAVIGTLFATIFAYYVAKKLPAIIEAISAAFMGLSGGFGAIQPKALVAAFAIGAVVLAIMELAKCWDKMEGWQKVISIIGVAAAAAGAAALAFGILHTTMSMGIAAAAIVAGIAAVTVAIASAQSKAKSFSASSVPSGLGTSPYGLSAANLPHLATGAVIPPNREFLAVLGDQKNGTNIEAPESTIEAAAERAVRRVMAEGGGGTSREIHLVISAKPGLAREFKVELDRESKRRGVTLVKGG